MKDFLWVFVGGGLGSAMRYGLGLWIRQTHYQIPWATLAANALGSLLIGLVLGGLVKNGTLSQQQSLFWATGFCGGLTTFSSFAFEQVTLFKNAAVGPLLAYNIITYIICILLLVAGVYFARLL